MIFNKFLLIPIFVLITYFLIVIHELGHYVVAKAYKLPVDEVSFGYGPSFLEFHVQETHFKFKWFPFGGYNKREVSFMDDCLPRTLVSLSGPLVNILLGLFLVGITVPHEVYQLLSFGHGVIMGNYFSAITDSLHGQFATDNMNLIIYSPNGILPLILAYIGLFSYYIGILNLLPVPPLDGGRFIFHLYEAFIKPEKREAHYENFNKLGIYFMVILNLLVVFSQRG